MSIVISVEQLSKRYRLGQIGTGTFANDLNIWWAKLWGKEDPTLRIGENDHGNREGNEIWALRDVSFTLNQGEVLGIIGKNGAGKSTLLKILSRITAPTSGRVKVKGRVASLLEVGTGFHPELTGRENIYLNGAILGMDRHEIDRKFDEIVDFSGIEKFIDTPVKRYSSGMYVRLAFAVAAHLEPEILLVDEVLAVGDAGFQNKCLGKMGEVASAGRTVIFVSHNTVAIENLCERSIFLDTGQLSIDGYTSDVLAQYSSMFQTRFGAIDLQDSLSERSGTGEARFISVKLFSSHGDEISSLHIGDELQIQMEILAHEDIKGVEVGVGLFNERGFRLTGFNSHDLNNLTLDFVSGQKAIVNCNLPPLYLAPGLYTLNLLMRTRDRNKTDFVRRAISFEIAPKNMFGTGRMPAGNNLIILIPSWDYSFINKTTNIKDNS